MELKAIPTMYAGTQFKSRMEAQCAFLFDQLSWKWKYETESLMLSNGVTYIPDFSFEDRSLIVECRGYRNRRGDDQIAGMIHDLPAISKKRDDNTSFLVMGPDECLVYHSDFEVVGKFPARITYCVRCADWHLQGREGDWQPLCPACVQLTFTEYALTVKTGKFFIAGLPFEQAVRGIFDRNSQESGWHCLFYEHVCESLNRYDLLRGEDTPDVLALQELFSRLLKTEEREL